MNEFNEDHTKRTKAFSKLSNDIKTLAEMSTIIIVRMNSVKYLA